jgi:exopolysaccharide biosynthesis protein
MAYRLHLLSLPLVLLSVVRCCYAETRHDPVLWQRLDSGIERAAFSFQSGSFFSSSIVLLRANLKEYRLKVVRASEFTWKRASVRALCLASGAQACINANFFDEQGKTLGLVISRGIVHQKIHKGGSTLTGILKSSGSEIGIVHREQFSPNGVLEAIQAGPRLVASGKAVTGLKDSYRSHHLSGVCVDGAERVIIYRVTSGLIGPSVQQLQDILQQPTIDCVDALNLDGGGSSHLFLTNAAPALGEAAQEENIPGTDDVPVAIGLFKLKE